MKKFDFNTKETTLEWLTSVLTEKGFLSDGDVISIKQERIHTPGYDNRLILFTLTIDYSTGSTGAKPSRLLLKMLPPENFNIIFQEIEYYAILSELDVTLPLLRCYAFEANPASNQGMLLLDDPTLTHHQTQWPIPPTMDQCKAAVSALSEIHGHWWNHERFGSRSFPAPERERFFNSFHRLEKIFGTFTDFLKDRLSDHRKGVYEQLLTQLPDLLWKRLSQNPKWTLTHMNTTFWNFYYPNVPGKHPCVSWSWWYRDVGLCTRDLSWMMAIHWYPDLRKNREQALLDLYLDELHHQHIDYSPEELQMDYRISLMNNLFRPLYYFAGRIPPNTWWNHIERGFAAFEDLDCMELLDSL